MLQIKAIYHLQATTTAAISLLADFMDVCVYMYRYSLLYNSPLPDISHLQLLLFTILCPQHN